MSVTQQYLLDSYRAAQRGDLLPPQPGLDAWQAARELRGHGAPRPPRTPRGLRATLTNLRTRLRPRKPRPCA